MSFGEPVDPRYLRFKKGWDDFFEGEIGALLVRWSPWEEGGGWFRYDREKFDHVDVGLPSNLSTPLKWAYDRKDDRWEWKAELSPFDGLPKLYAELDAAYTMLKARHPRAVWNPYDGSWRVVRSRSAAPSPTGPDPKPGPGTGRIPEELRSRLEQLDKLRTDEVITDAQLKQMTDELLREYL